MTKAGNERKISIWPLWRLEEESTRHHNGDRVQLNQASVRKRADTFQMTLSGLLQSVAQHYIAAGERQRLDEKGHSIEFGQATAC